MAVTFDLPADIEKELRQKVSNLEGQAKEALAIQCFRQGALTHLELSKILGLDRFETDALLSRHGVTEGTLTSEDLESDYRTLGRVLGRPR
jgi:predicted HTH domain antitoxin